MARETFSFGSDGEPFLSKEWLGSGSAVSLEVAGSRDLDVIQALARDEAFPARQIDLGEVSLQASAGKPVVLKGGSGQGNVGFAASASSGFGVYPDPVELVRTLGLDADLVEGLALEADPGANYLLLHWGYSLKAAGDLSGRPAQLGGGLGATFGVAAETGGLFAVVRRERRDARSRAALARLFGSWRLPKTVRRFDDLGEGTWVLSEVDGSLDVSLGLTYGYDYNWVRETDLGGLAGDLALKIQLGAAASLSAELGGRFAVVVGRESRRHALRLRLFKLRKKGWGFALSAGATVQGDTAGFAPQEFERFLAAVFGLHETQLLEDLEALRKWTDPQRLPELLAGLGREYLFEFLEEVTGLDPEATFAAARDGALAVVERLRSLDQEVASTLWRLLGENGLAELEEVRALAEEIAGAGDGAVVEILRSQLSEVGFFDTPRGEWLLSFAGERLLGLLSGPLDRLKRLAATTAEVLDPDRLGDPLANLQAFLDERLKLGAIEDALAEADPVAALDAWLSAKLARFAGEETLAGETLAKVGQAIENFRGKAQDFYDKTLAALNRGYQFSFTRTFQSSTARTALLDVEFDFTRGDAAVLEALLGEALRGRLDRLLTRPTAGVTLQAGVLTHETRRKSHVEISLPWFQKTTDWENLAAASLTVEEDEGGRLLVYSLSGVDRVAETAKARFQRASSLALTAHLPARLRGQVLNHQPKGEAHSYSYSLRQATVETLRRDLEVKLGPYVRTYFPEQFPEAGDGRTPGGFDEWLADLDKTVDPEIPGTHILGTTLFALELSVADKVVANWFRAGLTPTDLKRVSRRLQAKLKEVVYLYHVGDMGNLRGSLPRDVVLLYAALPPLTQIRVQGGQVQEVGAGLHWDYLQGALLAAVRHDPRTTQGLRRQLGEIHGLLLKRGLDAAARKYDPARGENLDRVRNGTVDNASVRLLLEGLLRAESRLVHAVAKAQRDLAAFRAAAPERPQKALAALADFARELTEAFHKDLRNVVVGSAIRPLGTLLFVEGAWAIDPALEEKNRLPDALLDFSVLQPGSAFLPETFVEGAMPGREDVLVRQVVARV